MFGAFCWFMMWFWLFSRFVPTVSINEVKEHLHVPAAEKTHGQT